MTTPGQPPGGQQPVQPPAQQQQQPQNLNQIVTDYLLKRGYLRTEEVFREEYKRVDNKGFPAPSKFEDYGPYKYAKAFQQLKTWVDGCLDIYRVELQKVLWPYFIYSYLDLIDQGFVKAASELLESEIVAKTFMDAHSDDLRALQTIKNKVQIKVHPTIRLYQQHKYNIPLNPHIASQLYAFLAREHEEGGGIVASILNAYCTIEKVTRGTPHPYSFEAIYSRGGDIDGAGAGILEGIPGIVTGVVNRDVTRQDVVLKLGPLPMEAELKEDVRSELEEYDQQALPPGEGGTPSLLAEFEAMIKKEDVPDAPSRNDIPLPPSRARDVATEILKVREYRDRFKIEGRTDGVGPAVSACMFTFHNTLGMYTCIDFSQDQKLVAAGTEDSYIRVWSINGKALPTRLPRERDMQANNRKLIGHSGRICSVHFSNAISSDGMQLFGGNSEATPDLYPRFLLSASADGQIRLWSLETWTCLCIYKGHEGPVVRAFWGPHGHYFASCGWDKTVRVWSQEKATAVRLLVGHDTSVSALTWHPNGTLLFSASDETDKTIRLWSVVTGDCVRLFTGHTTYITAMAVAPSGRILASADLGGTIYFWDIEKGIAIKKSRGHRPGGIWSLSFNVESNVLASGGADGTLRIWDVNPETKGSGTGADKCAGGGQADGDGGSASTQAPSTIKKKAKDVQVTPDQISCFVTKKTPVIKCEFTRMNLVVAGGWFNPDR